MAKKRSIESKDPLVAITKPKPSPLTVEMPDGDNAKYTAFALAIMQMPKIDIRNYEQVQQRILDYFELCANRDMKPGIVALALALGTDRRRLWEMKNGIANKTIPQEVHELVRTVYDSLEALWESYMQNGKINPVTGIFLGKNNFGYQDKQEYVLEPKTNTTVEPDVIISKYDELPE